MKRKIVHEELISHMYEGLYFVDGARRIISWNNGAEKITGFMAADVLGKHCYSNILNHVDQKGIALCFSGCPLHATMDDGTIRETNVYLQHKNGHRIPVSVKTVPQYDENEKIIGSFELFTEIQSELQLRQILEKYQKESSEDQLTGIPNRRYLETLIESKLREHSVVGLEFGVAFVDIDNFKKINDTYGHESGDEVLKLLVRTIESNLRKRDFIGRWGGEEFIIIFSDLNLDGLGVATEKIRALVSTSTLRFNNVEIPITISLGATLVRKDDTIISIVKRADEMMYVSKMTGRNRVTIG